MLLLLFRIVLRHDDEDEASSGLVATTLLFRSLVEVGTEKGVTKGLIGSIATFSTLNRTEKGLLDEDDDAEDCPNINDERIGFFQSNDDDVADEEEENMPFLL